MLWSAYRELDVDAALDASLGPGRRFLRMDLTKSPTWTHGSRLLHTVPVVYYPREASC